MNEFYKKLNEFNAQVSVDYSLEDEYLTGRLTYPGHFGSNYPWLYIDFKLEGNLSLYTLKRIESAYRDFAAAAGANLESIDIFFPASIMRVKLIYVEKAR